MKPVSIDRALQVLALALLVVLAAYLVTYVQEQRTQAECQAQVNTEFRERLTSRTGATSAERSATKDAITAALADPPLDGDARALELRRYLDALDRADATRPPLPAPAAGCA